VGVGHLDAEALEEALVNGVEELLFLAEVGDGLGGLFDGDVEVFEALGKLVAAEVARGERVDDFLDFLRDDVALHEIADVDDQIGLCLEHDFDVVGDCQPRQQREALDIIASGLFSSDSFRFKPAFMRKLQVDYLDRSDIFDVGLASAGVDYSLPGQVIKIQRDVLNLLMSDTVAQRIIDSEVKLDDPKRGFRLSELYVSLHRTIWSELKTGQEITPLRRSLQREHLSRVASALVRASSASPADARALLRQDARALRDELKAVPVKTSMSKETQAHIAESCRSGASNSPEAAPCAITLPMVCVTSSIWATQTSQLSSIATSTISCSLESPT